MRTFSSIPMYKGSSVITANTQKEADELAAAGYHQNYVHQEYPKFLHKPGGAQVLVKNESDEKQARAGGWESQPSEAPSSTQTVPAASSAGFSADRMYELEMLCGTLMARIQDLDSRTALLELKAVDTPSTDIPETKEQRLERKQSEMRASKSKE